MRVVARADGGIHQRARKQFVRRGRQPAAGRPGHHPGRDRPGGAAPAAWSRRCSRSWHSTRAPGSAGPAARRRPVEPTPEPFELDGMGLWPVPLTADEMERYYEGFSNSSLWPLYHDAVEPPVYKRRWWEEYRRVNQRFADATAQVAAPRRHRLGAGLPAPAGAGDAPRAAARPAHRLLPAHPVPAHRAVHAAAPAGRGAQGAARRRPGRLPAAARRPELPAAHPARAGAAPARGQRRAAGRAHGVRRRVPDLHRLRGDGTAGEQPGRPATGPPRSGPSSATRRRSSSASTGWTTPRASSGG